MAVNSFLPAAFISFAISSIQSFSKPAASLTPNTLVLAILLEVCAVYVFNILSRLLSKNLSKAESLSMFIVLEEKKLLFLPLSILFLISSIPSTNSPTFSEVNFISVLPCIKEASSLTKSSSSSVLLRSTILLSHILGK